MASWYPDAILCSCFRANTIQALQSTCHPASPSWAYSLRFVVTGH